MTDFTGRLEEEFSELADRIEKLESFILSDKFDPLPDEDKKDLREQNEHMLKYLRVLMNRCSRHCTGG